MERSRFEPLSPGTVDLRGLNRSKIARKSFQNRSSRVFSAGRDSVAHFRSSVEIRRHSAEMSQATEPRRMQFLAVVSSPGINSRLATPILDRKKDGGQNGGRGRELEMRMRRIIISFETVDRSSSQRHPHSLWETEVGKNNGWMMIEDLHQTLQSDANDLQRKDQSSFFPKPRRKSEELFGIMEVWVVIPERIRRENLLERTVEA